MKKTTLTIFLFALSLVLSVQATAYPIVVRTIHTNLSRITFVPGLSDKEKEDNPDSLGHRTPSRPVECTISDGAVNIDGVDTDDIMSFEVRDTDDNALVIFDNETDFTDYVFSLSGDYRVAFNTSDYTYMGYIYVP